MIIEAKSRIDYPAYRKFFFFTLMQSRKPRWKAPVLAALIPVLTFAFLILYLMDRDDVMNLAGFIIMLGISLILAGLLIFLPANTYRALADQLMVPTVYRFHDDHLEIRTEDRGDWVETYPYEKIQQAHRTADYFFINLGPGRICMIGNSDFVAGSPDALHDLLASQLGKRLIILDKSENRKTAG